MRTVFNTFGLFFAGLLALPTFAAISVSSFRAAVETNAYAPLDKSQYYSEQFIENISPAVANANGDWTGTNIGGTTPTWHWVGSANANVTTSYNQNSLQVSGNGSFFLDVTTTPDFINPNSVQLMYGPGSGAEVSCFFTVDQPFSFSMTALLSQYSLVRFASFTTNTTVYSKNNNSTSLFQVNQTGVLPPGSYSVGANAGFGVGLGDGANQTTKAGSFTNFNFTVSVPEPSLLGALGFGGLFLRRRR